MLKGIDRLVVAADDATEVGAAWERLLGAVECESRSVPSLGAIARQWRLADGRLEILEPTSADGIVGQAIAHRGSHLFAVGVTSSDVEGLAHRLRERHVHLDEGDGLIWFDCSDFGVPGLRLVVGPHHSDERVGLVDHFYETTLVVPDAASAVDRLVELVGLDPSCFKPVKSERFGYEGTLALFATDRLERIEIITPNRPDTTMDRWFKRHGAALYMAFGESSDIGKIEDRVRELPTAHASNQISPERTVDWLFLPPPVLAGVMLGVSRSTFAWGWLDQPEKVLYT